MDGPGVGVTDPFKPAVDAAIAAARERGCTCTYPDVWFVSTTKDGSYTAVVADHETCLKVPE